VSLSLSLSPSLSVEQRVMDALRWAASVRCANAKINRALRNL
jgi:hypothetical protein